MKCFMVIYHSKKEVVAYAGEPEKPTSLTALFSGPKDFDERKEFVIAKSLTTAAVAAERACAAGESVYAISESDTPCRVIE